MLQLGFASPTILHHPHSKCLLEYPFVRGSSEEEEGQIHSHCTLNSSNACPIYPWVRGGHSWAIWSLQGSHSLIKPRVSFCLIQISSKNLMILSTNIDMAKPTILAQECIPIMSKLQRCNLKKIGLFMGSWVLNEQPGFFKKIVWIGV